MLPVHALRMQVALQLDPLRFGVARMEGWRKVEGVSSICPSEGSRCPMSHRAARLKGRVRALQSHCKEPIRLSQRLSVTRAHFCRRRVRWGRAPAGIARTSLASPSILSGHSIE